MNLFDVLPKEVKDSLWVLLVAVFTFIARKLRPKVEGTALVQKKAVIETEQLNALSAVERVKQELQETFDTTERELRQAHALEMVKWQQRDDDLRSTVKDLVEQSRKSAELHAAALSQMQLYVNKLLDENAQMREESDEYKHARDLLQGQLDSCQEVFRKREKDLEEEKLRWDAVIKSLRARLKDMTNRGVEKGVRLTGSDIFPEGGG